MRRAHQFLQMRRTQVLGEPAGPELERQRLLRGTAADITHKHHSLGHERLPSVVAEAYVSRSCGAISVRGVVNRDRDTPARLHGDPWAIDFLEAGGDMIVSKALKPAVVMLSAVLVRAKADPAFRGLVHDAVRLVLVAKEAAGLLPCAA